MKEPVSKIINYKARCKGCGVCAVVCNLKSITIGLNSYGEYQPDVDLDSCTRCGMCKKVCPMEETHVTSKLKDLIGDFSESYVSHSSERERRVKCSSGGVVTEVLTHLLTNKKIDKAICVGFDSGAVPYFKSQVCQSVDEVFKSRGSKYYPIEFSDVLEKVKVSDSSYAVVCLPCVATAIRRLKKNDTRFNNIKYIIAIACGHNKTTNYTDFILGHYKMQPDFKSISFRNKGDYSFSNYSFKAEDSSGKIIEENFVNGFINRLWCEYYFAQEACFQCTDLFGVDADISCMDAWLHPYNKSKAGYNFVLVKKDMAQDLIEQNTRLQYKKISLDNVIQSQRIIYDTKKNLRVPNDYVENAKISEDFDVKKENFEVILKELSKTKNNDNATRSKLASCFRVLSLVKEKVKLGVGYYENLIGR